MKKKLSLLLAVVMVLSGFVSFNAASAQTAANVSAQASVLPIQSMPAFCAYVSNNVYVGSTDRTSASDVTKLQTFLNARGYLNVSATGYFGQLTAQAVRSFQAQNGISATGYVGPLTRAKIKEMSCGPIVILPPPVNGQSPVISSVGGPSQLVVNQSGTWSVSAYDANNAYDSNLTYSVDWGDQLYAYPATGAIAPQASVSQTSTFSHAYASVGTYTITFTVRNAQGYSNASTLTVSVRNDFVIDPPALGIQPAIVSFSPQTAQVGSTLTIQGNNFTQGQNTIYLNDGFAASAYSNDGHTLSFQIPAAYSPLCTSGTYCLMSLRMITPGTYNVKVSNSNGTSNNVQLTINVNGGVTTKGIPHLDGYSSNTISTETSEYKDVSILGSGFTQNNTVYVNGTGTYFNVPSSNGTEIHFSVPRRNQSNCNKNACTDVYLTAYVNFNAMVSNENGNSNSLYVDLNNSTY